MNEPGMEILLARETCPKCGCDRVSLKWKPEIIEHPVNRAVMREPTPEHVLVVCSQCGYGWRRLPLKVGP